MGSARWWKRRRSSDLLFQDVVRSVVIQAPPAQVWELVADTAQFHRTATAEHLWTFVLLGTPAGQVGERRVTLERSPDGHVSATLVERTEMVPGRRLVTRTLTSPLATTTTVEPRGDGACELTIQSQSVGPPGGLQARLDAIAERLDRRLARIAAVATGQAPPPEPESDPWTDSSWTTHRVTRHGTVWAPPSRVWPVVRLTGGEQRWVERENAYLATVPGSPEGEVGELICLVFGSTSSVGVQEVVAHEVDRLYAVRHVSSAIPATRTVTLAPSTFGTDVTVEIEFQVPPSMNPDEHAERFGRTAEAFLHCYQRTAT